MDESEAIKKLISTFEAERRVRLQKVIVLNSVGWPLLVIGVALLFVYVFFTQHAALLIIGTILTVAGLVLAVVAGTKKSSFIRSVSKRLQAEIDKELFPNATYNVNGLPIQTIMKPGFFAAPDRYYTRNYMGATYKGIQFEKSHYQLQRREQRSDGHGNTSTNYVDYAVGTMYHFIYGRDFGGVLKVLEKSGFNFSRSGGLPKYETEYINFNRKFAVFSSDQQLVFYLLTPQIQEKIMSLESKAKGQFYMAFIKDELYIATNDNDNSISIPFDKEMTDESMAGIVEYMAIPAVFITLLGLTKAKFEKNAGVK
ncbi:MAG: DUF3137 domain-containing protein [Bacilli bacterium]|jgi:hypothetical protein|nr:DUF3137 domain-containing protein [Bacilli bacterium]